VDFGNSEIKNCFSSITFSYFNALLNKEQLVYWTAQKIISPIQIFFIINGDVEFSVVSKK
jgi:hypothetical protein